MYVNSLFIQKGDYPESGKDIFLYFKDQSGKERLDSIAAYVNDKGEKKKGYFRYWAPGRVIEHDGKFYLYVTFVKPGDKMGTYVLVADRPEGPFRFTEGKGLFVSGEEVDSPAIIDDIDGEPFIDDDGTAYTFVYDNRPHSDLGFWKLESEDQWHQWEFGLQQQSHMEQLASCGFYALKTLGKL